MPSNTHVQSAYQLFLDQGITGAVAILAILALIWAIIKLLAAKDERIKDHTTFAASIHKTNEMIAALTLEVNKTAAVTGADASRSANAMAAQNQSLQKSVEDLERQVSQLRDEQMRLVAGLTNGGSVGRGRR